jgi:hypothetical protein
MSTITVPCAYKNSTPLASTSATGTSTKNYVTDSCGIKFFDSDGAYIEGMNDRFIQGGIQEIRINDKNEIYLVASTNMIYKLAMNTK